MKGIKFIAKLAKARAEMREKLLKAGVPASEIEWALKEAFQGKMQEMVEEEIRTLRKKRKEKKDG